jgi:hypothetical protein
LNPSRSSRRAMRLRKGDSGAVVSTGSFGKFCKSEVIWVADTTETTMDEERASRYSIEVREREAGESIRNASMLL